MQRTAIVASAFALLLTGTALAQEAAPAGEAPPPAAAMPAAPAMEAPTPPAEPASPGMMGPGFMMQGHAWSGGHPPIQGWAGRRGDGRPGTWARVHHHRGPSGAAFRLSKGAGGPSISIKCADGDSTQACVEAIMPLLDKLLPMRPDAATGQ